MNIVSSPQTQTVAVGVESDDLFKEILKNVPSRNRKNVHYILDKMFQLKDVALWNESGEFISNGSVIHGSHIFDLVKSITASHMVDARRRPQGWRDFLRAFADLNIPLSTVPNRRAKDEISSFKDNYTPTRTSETPFKSLILDSAPWITF